MKFKFFAAWIKISILKPFKICLNRSDKMKKNLRKNSIWKLFSLWKILQKKINTEIKEDSRAKGRRLRYQKSCSKHVNKHIKEKRELIRWLRQRKSQYFTRITSFGLAPAWPVGGGAKRWQKKMRVGLDFAIFEDFMEALVFWCRTCFFVQEWTNTVPKTGEILIGLRFFRKFKSTN